MHNGIEKDVGVVFVKIVGLKSLAVDWCLFNLSCDAELVLS